LPLAPAERRNPLSRCRSFSIPSRRRRYSQGLLDRAEEAFVVARLFNKIDRTRLHRLHGGRYIAVPGHHDDRQTKTETVEQSLKFEPVYARHAKIQKQAAVLQTRRRLEETECGFVYRRPEPDGVQEWLE